MNNSLTGEFFSDGGVKYRVSEAYKRADHPMLLFRKDKAGRWRCYAASYVKGKRIFFRFHAFGAPNFAAKER